jgi:hypothetical protein
MKGNALIFSALYPQILRKRPKVLPNSAFGAPIFPPGGASFFAYVIGINQ